MACARPTNLTKKLIDQIDPGISQPRLAIREATPLDRVRCGVAQPTGAFYHMQAPTPC
jgi:hypothetical protein